MFPPLWLYRPEKAARDGALPRPALPMFSASTWPKPITWMSNVRPLRPGSHDRVKRPDQLQADQNHRLTRQKIK